MSATTMRFATIAALLNWKETTLVNGVTGTAAERLTGSRGLIVDTSTPEVRGAYQIKGKSLAGGASLIIDMSGGLVDHWNVTLSDISRLRGLFFRNNSTVDYLLDMAIANRWVGAFLGTIGEKILVPPGHFWMIGGPTAYGVVPTTGDQFTVKNNGGSAGTFDLVLLLDWDV